MSKIVIPDVIDARHGSESTHTCTGTWDYAGQNAQGHNIYRCEGGRNTTGPHYLIEKHDDGAHSCTAACGSAGIEVVWSMVCGVSPFARACEPEVAGVDMPSDVMAWAVAHGLNMDDPDVYVLVAPMDEAGEILGEIVHMAGELPADAVTRIRKAIEEDDQAREERNQP